MASCVYIINMIKCFPRMKLLNCHATPGYYQHGFKMLIRQSEGNSPHPRWTIQVVLNTAPHHCIRRSPNPPTIAAVLLAEAWRFAKMHGRYII